jgi:TolB protein
MDADGSNIKRLIRSRSIDTEPTWSPDGKSIFFVSDRGGGPQIYKMNLDDDEAKRVTFEGRYNVSPRLSPDGKLLTFITMEQGSFRVAVQNLISNQVMKLTVGRNDESPIFSPNGHMILYTKKLQGEKAEIATVSLNGLKSVKIDVGKELTQEPTWSPFDF